MFNNTDLSRFGLLWQEALMKNYLLVNFSLNLGRILPPVDDPLTPKPPAVFIAASRRESDAHNG